MIVGQLLHPAKLIARKAETGGSCGAVVIVRTRVGVGVSLVGGGAGVLVFERSISAPQTAIIFGQPSRHPFKSIFTISTSRLRPSPTGAVVRCPLAPCGTTAAGSDGPCGLNGPINKRHPKENMLRPWRCSDKGRMRHFWCRDGIQDVLVSLLRAIQGAHTPPRVMLMVALTEICPPCHLDLWLCDGVSRAARARSPRRSQTLLPLGWMKSTLPLPTHTFYSDMLLFVHVVVFLLLPDLAPRGREWPRAHKADEHVARARGGWLARVAHAPG